MAEGAIRATVYDDTIVFVFCQEKFKCWLWLAPKILLFVSDKTCEDIAAFACAGRYTEKFSMEYETEKARNCRSQFCVYFLLNKYYLI